MRFASKLIPVLAGTLAVLSSAACWAQGAVPEPTLSRSSKVWMGYAVMFVLAAVVIAVSLMPSKRSHQD